MKLSGSLCSQTDFASVSVPSRNPFRCYLLPTQSSSTWTAFRRMRPLKPSGRWRSADNHSSERLGLKRKTKSEPVMGRHTICPLEQVLRGLVRLHPGDEVLHDSSITAMKAGWHGDWRTRRWSRVCGGLHFLRELLEGGYHLVVITRRYGSSAGTRQTPVPRAARRDFRTRTARVRVTKITAGSFHYGFGLERARRAIKLSTDRADTETEGPVSRREANPYGLRRDKRSQHS